MKKYRILSAVLAVSLLASSCAVSDSGSDTASEASTSASETELLTEPAVTTAAATAPPEAIDSDGRAVAAYGTAEIDGKIDDVWDNAAVIVPGIVSSTAVEASGEFRLLWDENALYTLYIVTDPTLNKDSINTYEQDSVELFVDEYNDKASTYKSDDVHYRVNFDNETSVDSGEETRWSTAAAPLADDDGNVTGYIAESCFMWEKAQSNGAVMGLELQINDAGAGGSRVGTVNVFDESGTAWSDPSKMGEMILVGMPEGEAAAANPSKLKGYLSMVEKFNLEPYANPEVLDKPISDAKLLLEKEGATQKEYDDAFQALKDALAKLNDGSGFTSPAYLQECEGLPDTFTFADGSKVSSKEDWYKRAEELSGMYQYYMYGVVRDRENEALTYTANEKSLDVTVSSDGRKGSFNAAVYLPDDSAVECPEGGWPVIIAFGWLSQIEYANSRGYAVITLDTNQIASDSMARTGAFYDIYPYGDAWQEQTGVLMAWSWGISKILDALDEGAGDVYNINKENNIVTGVSRWGKAAAVAGAFDERIKICAPACSGAGGMATFRYTSTGNSYDHSSVGGPDAYEMTANESLSNIQSSSERHWFNDTFLKISGASSLPFDQYMLASLCAAEDRYLFIIAAYQGDDWTNPPAMYMTYLKAKEVYDYLGISDNIAVQMHLTGHAVIDEDMVYLLDYSDLHLYGKAPSSDMSKLTSTVYGLEENRYDEFYELLEK